MHDPKLAADQMLRACREIASRVAAGEQNVVERYLERSPDWRGQANLLRTDSLATDSPLVESLLELIYAEVVARQPTARPADLAELIGRFPQLEHRLERLWQVHHALAEPLSMVDTEQLAEQTVGQVVGRGPAIGPLPHHLEPTQIGRYHLRERLGQGGMGVVHRAVQGGLDRVVAVKVLTSSETSMDQRQRFLNEARSIAQLQHPHIVQIIEVGEQQGILFIAMEYLAGGSLAESLRHTLWQPMQVADLLRKLCEGVQAAHDKGIVHRDLKPANILFSADHVPKIVDFGLAKLLDENVNEYATRTGAIVGTPGYMAPEQVSRVSTPIDRRADLFALGSLLYECLTGRPPFRGETIWDTLHQIEFDDPLPPRQLLPTVPRDLEAICLRCLEKKPQQRYPTATALRDDLVRFLEGKSIQSQPIRGLRRSSQWIRRHRRLVALFVTSFAVISMALMSMLWQWHRVTEQTQQVAKLVQEQHYTSYCHQTALAQLMLADNNSERAREVLQDCPSPWRDWEWHYLVQRCQPEWQILEGHNRLLRGLSFDSSNRRLFSAAGNFGDAEGGELYVWQLGRGTMPVPQKISLATPAMGLAYNPGHDLLAAMCVNFHGRASGVAFLHAKSTTLRNLTAEREGGQHSGAFSPDGKLLVTGGNDGRVRWWDVASGALIRASAGHEQAIFALSVSRDGKLVVSGSRDRTVRLWDAESGEETLKLDAGSDVRAVAFHPSGQRIYAGGYGGKLHTWNLRPTPWHGFHRQVELRSEIVCSLACTLDGQELLCGTSHGQIYRWSEDLTKKHRNFGAQREAVRCLAISADGRYVASGASRQIKIWDRQARPNPQVLALPQQPVRAMAWAHDGQRLYLAPQTLTQQKPEASPNPISQSNAQQFETPQGNILQVDATQGTSETLAKLPSWVNDLVLHPEHDQLLCACADGSLHRIDAASGVSQSWPKVHQGPATAVAVSPRGTHISSVGKDGQLIWHPPTIEPPIRVDAPLPTTPFTDVEFLDEETVVTADEQGTVRTWNVLGAHNKLCQLDQAIECCLFHRASGTLALMGQTKIILLTNCRVDASSQVSYGTMTTIQESKPVQDMAFSPTGTRLITMAHDAMVRIWDVATCREVLALTSEHDGQGSIALDRSGRYLAATSHATLTIYDAGLGFQAQHKGRAIR